MIKAKTMTHWENENYDYPLPDVSHFSKKEAENKNEYQHIPCCYLCAQV